MTATTRKDAAANGLLTYNTGKPCGRGHFAARYTSTGNCSECLKSTRQQFADAVKLARAPTTADRGTLFTYLLHPEDHAAALAYCQSLDVQRGRAPQAGPLVAAAPVLVSATAAEVQAHRQRILGEHAVPQATNGAGHMTAEMRAQLIAAGLLTNGS